MLRLLLIAGFLPVSVGTVAAAFQFGEDTRVGTLLINLGTEIFGVFITVAVVEMFLDRRRKQDRARDIAWSTLHQMERAIWVWQGGPRQAKTDELLGIISGIRSEAPPEPVTRSILVSLGTHAREVLDREAPSIRTLPRLGSALEDLTSLRSLTDGGSVSLRMVAEVLESATTDIARILDLPCQRIPSALIPYRDASSEAQAQRYQAGYGRAFDPEIFERTSMEESGRATSGP